MPRKHGVQSDRIEQFHRVSQFHSALAQLLKHCLRSAALRPARVVQVGPAAANPVQLLGRIDGLKPGGKSPGNLLGPRVIQAAEQLVQSLTRPGVAVPARNCKAAYRLYRVEQFRAAPILDHGPDQTAKLMHVLT